MSAGSAGLLPERNSRSRLRTTGRRPPSASSIRGDVINGRRRTLRGRLRTVGSNIFGQTTDRHCRARTASRLLSVSQHPGVLQCRGAAKSRTSFLTSPISRRCCSLALQDDGITMYISAPSSQTVILVDDDIEVTDILSRFIVRAGIGVQVTHSGVPILRLLPKIVDSANAALVLRNSILDKVFLKGVMNRSPSRGMPRLREKCGTQG